MLAANPSRAQSQHKHRSDSRWSRRPIWCTPASNPT